MVSRLRISSMDPRHRNICAYKSRSYRFTRQYGAPAQLKEGCLKGPHVEIMDIESVILKATLCGRGVLICVIPIIHM